jgi:hypothetical protein
MDPARLWLDCTVDSLVTNGSNDPNDCVPVAGGEGPLGAQLEARRGTALQSTTVTGKRPPTSCRDKIDSNGKSSLEAIVDALFDSSRSPLDAKNLSGFPDEIATLLSAFHLNSTMGIAADKQPNSYIIDHALVDISFPQSSTLLLKATTLGLAVPSAHGVLASVQYGYLKIPPHWFTLRLGTAARYAFEDSSLQKARGMTDATQLINAVFGLARLSDRGRLLTGCDALDAALCDQVKESRGCLLGACRTGLVALAQKLSGAFDSLDGDGLDFYLTGSAPLADSNGDGRADSLGLVRSSTGLAASGLWVGQILSGAGSCGVSGSWAASSVAAP